jgi:putative mRNA 3-end processing factor
MNQPLLIFAEKGIYCPLADLYVDPWKPVAKAIITHGHADHARRGHQHYLTHRNSAHVLRSRLGQKISVESVEYGEAFCQNGVKISLHPAGHVFGSSQVRFEFNGEVWVVSGDYKLTDDHISTPFEPVKCHVFVTESTFGLPIYHWRPQEQIIQEIEHWWAINRQLGITSVLIGYSLGKAQRVLHHLKASIGDIFAHRAITSVNQILETAGIRLPRVKPLPAKNLKTLVQGELVYLPPGALRNGWLEELEPLALAYTSGWMPLTTQSNRPRNVQCFMLSDHADWDELNRAVAASTAEHICVTHGNSDIFARWLKECGYSVELIETRYNGEFGEIESSTTE